MSREISLEHPALVALIRAHAARFWPKNPVVSATGILEADPSGRVNCTDSVSSTRLSISSCGFAGEIHLKLGPSPKNGAAPKKRQRGSKSA